MSNDNFQKIVEYFNITRKKYIFQKELDKRWDWDWTSNLRPIIKYIFKIPKQSNMYNLQFNVSK